MPPVDESKLTNVERWSVLADRIDEHRRETDESRWRRGQEGLVAARRHLTLVQPDDDR
jgi:hypothetical protein